jgi:hypothetical protein
MLCLGLFCGQNDYNQKLFEGDYEEKKRVAN